MTSARKTHFIDELKQIYSKAIADATEAESRAAEASNEILKDARRKEDAKGATEAGRLAVGHRRRRQRAIRELETLIAFAASGVRDFREDDAVGLGAFVDVHIEALDADDGGGDGGGDGEGDGGGEGEERTLFILPVGAGNELTGPGGDGFVHVVTPASPVGKALLGALLGDVVEVLIDGNDREWELLDLC